MTIQFTTPRDVTLRSTTTRMEKHGEEDKAAIDFEMSVTGGNDLLNMFHPDLRVSLFKPLTERAGELPLPTDDLPSIRFAHLKLPMQFGFEHSGMTLHVFYGTNDQKPAMVFADVTLNKARIEQLIEGGSVEIRFKLATKDINEKTIGKMSLLQGHTITIRLLPAEVAESPVDTRAKAKAEAESLFGKPAQKTPEEAFTGSAA